MSIGTTEPGIGIAHSIVAFPRLAALIAILIGAVLLFTNGDMFRITNDTVAEACVLMNSDDFKGLQFDKVTNEQLALTPNSIEELVECLPN